MEIRKYRGGGLADLGAPGIPQANVELYLRSAQGETFYVGSLEEGIAHLLSKDGYRLSINCWPNGAGWGLHQRRFGVVIRRLGDELVTELEAPGVFPDTPGRVLLVQEPAKRRIIRVHRDENGVPGLPLSSTILEPGEEVPWQPESPWGETDLPVYSQEELGRGMKVLLRLHRRFIEIPSRLPDVLKALRRLATRTGLRRAT